MTDRSAYDVVISHDGLSGLGIIEYRGQHEFSLNPFAFSVYLAVCLTPKGTDSPSTVLLRRHLVRGLEQTFFRALPEEEKFKQLSLYGIGHFLDTAGMPSVVPDIGSPLEVDITSALEALFDRPRPQALDSAVLAYAAAKIYWGWRYGLMQVRFSLADHLRLAVPQGDIARVARFGDSVYWTRIEGTSPAFSPTGKLIRDLPAGRFPGLEQSPVIQVQSKLEAPRYAAVAEHFSKAVDFLTGPSQDLANSAKEATLAVESLAMIVTGRTKGTLGDCVKDLRSRGSVSAPLDKIFEALWGYASEEPGLRHGKASPPSLAERDATFVVNASASAILFLLDLDR